MKNGGFTLLELVVVVVILGLLASLAGPRLVRAYQNRLTSSAAETFVRAHELARASAVRFGGSAALNIDAAGARFWVDVDTSGLGQRATVGRSTSYADQGVSLTSTHTKLCFDARGLRSTRGDCPAGAATVVFAFGQRVDSVQITALGKVLR